MEAVVEVVGADDLTAGIELDGQIPAAAPSSPTVDDLRSTIGPTVLESFSLEYLPELVERIARGEQRDEVARAVGAALLALIAVALIWTPELLFRLAPGDPVSRMVDPDMTPEDSTSH